MPTVDDIGRGRGVLAVLAVGATILTGCGGDAAPPGTDAEVAARVCAPILDYRNDVSVALAEAQSDVRQGGEDPRCAFLPALRRLRDATGDLGEAFFALELDRSDAGRRALDDQLSNGVEVAGDAWQELIAEFEAIPDPDPESVTSRLAAAFVGSEKPVEEVKPEVQDDLGDADLEAAFQSEATCSFTTLR